MVGIDIVEIEQIKDIYQKHGTQFLEKILNEEEINNLSQEDCNFFRDLSCYVASKEAIYKACSEEDFDWQEISICNITKAPLVHIKRSDFVKKIKLTVAASKTIVISLALIV